MRVCELLPQGIDAALVDDEKNRQYLTGVRSSAGTVVVTREETYLIIDFRYIEMARAAARDCQVLLQDKLCAQIGELFARHGVRSYGVVDSLCSLSKARGWMEKLPAQLVDGSGFEEVLGGLRMRKSATEIAKIKAAQALTDEAFQHILGHIAPGKTEREIALEMEFFIRRQGAEGVSFDFIVVGGQNSSKPHGVPGDYALQAGDFLTMDFGCTVDGYCSDMTRTVALGKVSEKQRQIYDIVLKANEIGIAAAQAGVVCEEVDRASRDYIASFGYGAQFGHGLGHGVGLDIHEEPRFSPGCKTALEEGMVITVEPGIYLPGEFGVRIEDMVVITPQGTEDITRSPKELLLL